jgi:hypothetical protein
LCVYVWVFVSLYLEKKYIYQFAPNLASLFLQSRKRIQVGQKCGNFPWVRFPGRAANVARKLNTTEKRRWEQTCLSRRGDYTNEEPNSKTLSWVWLPVKMFSVARKLNAIEERRKDQNCLFRRGYYRNTGTNATTPKNCPGAEFWRGWFRYLGNHERSTTLGRPQPSVATPTVTTPKDSIYTVDGLTEATRHGFVEPTLRLAKHRRDVDTKFHSWA